MKKTNRLKKLFDLLQLSRRKRRWMLAAALPAVVSAMLLVLPMALPSSAASVSVNVNHSTLYKGQDLLKSGVTYVPLRAFADAIYDGFAVTWNGATRTATVREGDFVLTARVGDRYITAGGNRIYSSASNLLIGNRIHVPVRSVCTAMGLTVDWNTARRTVTVQGRYLANGDAEHLPPADNRPGEGDGSDVGSGSVIDQQDLYWLARIIHAESRGEPMAGKIAVGTVVMNRVKSSLYPNTVYGVIFDRKHGTQFTPAANGAIYNEPGADSIEAARRVLSGERTDPRILFFVNERLAPGNWVSKNRTFVMTIGNHDFYM